MITREDLGNWHMRPRLFLDMKDGYSNHSVCVENPRLTRVSAGPRGRRSKIKSHTVKLYVDGIECPDIDAVLVMLNATPVESKESSNARPVHEDGQREPGA